jgi:hypothetical protein
MACEELLPLESCDLPPKATNGRFENFDKIPPQVGLLVQQCSGRGCSGYGGFNSSWWNEI